MIQPLLLIPSFLQEGSCHEYFKCSPFRCSPLILLDNSFSPSSFWVFLFLLFPPPLPRCPLSKRRVLCFLPQGKDSMPKQGREGEKKRGERKWKQKWKGGMQERGNDKDVAVLVGAGEMHWRAQDHLLWGGMSVDESQGSGEWVVEWSLRRGLWLGRREFEVDLKCA